MMIKNPMILISKVEDSPEEFEHDSEHSCHDPSHMMSVLSPLNFGESLNNNVLSDPVVYFELDFDHSS